MMTQATWTNQEAVLAEVKPNRMKFVVGGLLIFAAIIFLSVNALQGSTQLYLTVGEFYDQQSQLSGRDLRVSGWVLGDSIQYTQIDDQNSRLEFDIVDDLENPGQRLHIVAMNEPIPDLLQHEAQALVDGHSENGEFQANQGGLMLKCPTKYEEAGPEIRG
jgi:cytochrome c-type biogenesis protein CcmE